ncbi:hypothetical protein SAMN05880592_11657 [Bosea sp. TND4EK4]|nr:hypothetical protein SAMN05880592_11657 [Bosea sp. TND4EK4]
MAMKPTIKTMAVSPPMMMFRRGDGNMERMELSMMIVIGAIIIMVM